jgi:oligosaccharide reducing-end xylanase
MWKANVIPWLLVIVSLLLSACQTVKSVSDPTVAPSPAAPTLTHPPATATPAPLEGAIKTGMYRDLFQEYLGISDLGVQTRLEDTFQQLFYGTDASERVYYPVEPEMAYILDVGNQDVRSEGMSYGMMIAVQMDKQAEFDRLWKWAKTYMYQADGPYQGYFAWHCTPDGEQLDANPASDGEEWFAMALFFADARWGSGQEIFDYRSEAQAILHTALHKIEEPNGSIGANLFDPQAKQVVFVPRLGPDSTFTDPSYHLPHFYQLWASYADEDQAFWAEAARISREFLMRAAHPQTGLMPDYANFDGTPRTDSGDHQDFRFDAWRTLANVAMDYAWFADPAAADWEAWQSERVLDFLASQGMDGYPNQYTLSGESLSNDHSTGLVSTAAVAALAAGPEKGKPFVQALWDTPVPTGTWRYYDGMLYLLALLQVSGNFRIY